jgi:hypothetical protein
MPTKHEVVRSAPELVSALDRHAARIRIDGTIQGLGTLHLPAGVALEGGTLVFGARGVVLGPDAALEGVEVLCPEHEVAVTNDVGVEDLGTLALVGVRARGQVLLRAAGAVRRGAIIVSDLLVMAADLRGRLERPHGFGVDAMQGAVTVWNQQPDPAAELRAQLTGVSAGTDRTPVRGSGVFVGGHRDDEGNPVGGRVDVSVLRTSTIVTDGGIPVGTPDLISGGVFVQSGARVRSVVNDGPVTTFGANDMALDNWGRVDEWTANAPVTTRGASGIGFVNFGRLGRLDVRGPIETFGVGARGFNLYDGELASASFHSIVTHADGAVGVQVARPMPKLTVRGDVRTEGGRGHSLVRGEQVELEAIALSVKTGGSIGEATVGGRLETRGDRVVTVELNGTVGRLEVAGGVIATGRDSDAARVSPETGAALAGVVVRSEQGRDFASAGD